MTASYSSCMVLCLQPFVTVECVFCMFSRVEAKFEFDLMIDFIATMRSTLKSRICTKSGICTKKAESAQKVESAQKAEFSWFYVKSCTPRLLYWKRWNLHIKQNLQKKGESAQKTESVQESGICRRKWNLHKKAEFAQMMQTTQWGRKTLTNQMFFILKHNNKVFFNMICDVQLKTQICTTPDICNLSCLTTTMMDCAYGLNINAYIWKLEEFLQFPLHHIELHLSAHSTQCATESHRKTLNLDNMER